MKTLITVLAFAIVIIVPGLTEPAGARAAARKTEPAASKLGAPTFARPAARAASQAEFVFPTDQQLCQSGRTDFCHWRGYPLWQWYSGA